MDVPANPPLIGIPACRKDLGTHTAHQVVDKYVEAVVLVSGGVPIILPAIGEDLDIGTIIERLDGLLLTGSPSNVDPNFYGGPSPRPDNEADPLRDATVLPLIRLALAERVPLFAICRGIQELNVALGGSLHQHVHEVPGRRDHRSDKTRDHAGRYGPAHAITLVEGGLLQRLFGGVGEIEVNSLHGQAIDRLADGLVAEAFADDGTIEAVSVKGAAAFALGVQWHPEWRPLDNPWSRRLFAAFGEAARARANGKVGHGAVRRVA